MQAPYKCNDNDLHIKIGLNTDKVNFLDVTMDL